MRNSSVIFVGGFTLVFGFFAVQSFNADARALRTADIRAQQLQADLIAMTGCYLSTYYMATPSDFDGWSKTNKTCNGGKLDYGITVLATDGGGNPTRCMVVSTGKMGSNTMGWITVTKRAEIIKGVNGRGKYAKWDQWTIQKVYTDPYTLADILE
ncbi:MAG: hypothetical protein A3H45_07130 [Ignavibacteria bacterium RIFCSPLOWO2_02_FULL_55_14]|nr:MAG: hypothetical protein A3H45_07130 [Ignavibacteria bacterium RIFCSPLOWO2_02_FULL_55_14]